MIVGVKDGCVVLESNEVDLKIGPDREVYSRIGKYIKPQREGEKPQYEKSMNYKTLGRRVPRGLSAEEKQIFLIKLRTRIVERMNAPGEDEAEKEVDDKTDTEMMEDETHGRDKKHTS